MEKLITIVVRVFACAFFIQPIIVVLVLLPAVKTKPSGILWLLFGLAALLCITVGVVIWRYAPKFFYSIFSKQIDILKENT